MKSRYLTEAFKALERLDEEDFNLSSADALDNMDSFYKDEDDKDVTKIIDADAEDESELKDSYVGDVILECNVCHSLVYKNPDEVMIDEEDESIANTSDECPYCYGHEGFKIVGQVEPYNEEESEELADADEEDIDLDDDEDSEDVVLDDEDDDELEESYIREAFDSINVKSDGRELSMTSDEDGGIHIDETPIHDEFEDDEFSGDTMIAPVDDDMQADIEDNSEDEYPEDELVPDENGEVEVDMDDFDDEGFNELGESYLRNVYDNVKSFKVTNASMNENLIKIDGDITFKSGSKKPTSFIFESKDITNNGKIRFIGENKQITKGKKTFTLTANLRNKKLVCESLNYNYKAKNAEGKSVRLYKTIRL